MVLFVLPGWDLVFTAHVAEQEHINELIDQQRYEELPEVWDSDGASGLFALFGGWLVPLAYFVLCLAVYTLAANIRHPFTSKQSPDKALQADAAKPHR